MSDHELLRHSRHALLEGFDDAGVEAVQNARVLIVGAGGLGCPAATYLTASGVGTIEWIDGDTVDATNLARQTLFGPADIGEAKVLAGARALVRLNPNTRVITTQAFADEVILNRAVAHADVVLDCTDQWAIRQLINAACVRHAVPLVSAAAIEWSGQLMTIDPRRPDSACYACVFDPQAEPEAHACGAFGVLSPLVGSMGCLQAAEALKILISINRSLATTGATPVAQNLSLLDIKTGIWQQLAVSRNPDCPVCGAGLAHVPSESRQTKSEG